MAQVVDENTPLVSGAEAVDEEEIEIDGDEDLEEDIEAGEGGEGKKKKDKKEKKKDKKEKKKELEEEEKIKKEEEKAKRPPKDDDIKTHMANERTFFKWLFFGFHIGAMGTFILTFFAPTAPYRVHMVLFIWLIAFFFIYYGLFRYFQRRKALRMGLRDPEDWDDPTAPILMSGALFLIVVGIIIYAIVTHQVPSKKGWSDVEKQP